MNWKELEKLNTNPISTINWKIGTENVTVKSFPHFRFLPPFILLSVPSEKSIHRSAFIEEEHSPNGIWERPVHATLLILSNYNCCMVWPRIFVRKFRFQFNDLLKSFRVKFDLKDIALCNSSQTRRNPSNAILFRIFHADVLATYISPRIVRWVSFGEQRLDYTIIGQWNGKIFLECFNTSLCRFSKNQFGRTKYGRTKKGQTKIPQMETIIKNYLVRITNYWRLEIVPEFKIGCGYEIGFQNLFLLNRNNIVRNTSQSLGFSFRLAWSSKWYLRNGSNDFNHSWLEWRKTCTPFVSLLHSETLPMCKAEEWGYTRKKQSYKIHW